MDTLVSAWQWLTSISVFGQTLAHWIGAIITFMVVWGALHAVMGALIKKLKQWAKKTSITFDDFLIGLLEKIHPLFYAAFALGAACWWITLPASLTTLINGLPVLAVLFQIGVWAAPVIRFLVKHYIHSRPDPQQQVMLQTMEGPANFIGILMVWSVLVLLALQNLGINITALVASMGIGGIAIALAVQTILQDLFSAFSIVVDKPFMVGDFIKVDANVVGHVQHIGLKTTRIQTISGELMVVSNSDLLSSRIQNFAHLKERRIMFGFGVLYQTPVATVKEIGGWVKTIVENTPNCRFDRAHFKGFGDSSLDFEVVYYVEDAEYLVYMEAQQAINVALMEKCEAENVGFAYPTRTVFLTQEEPLKFTTVGS